LDNKLGRMRQRASKLQQEIGNLAATAAQCGPTPALEKEIDSRQHELDEITRQLGDRQLLKVDVQKAKAELEKHVSGIHMVPQVEGKHGHYVAEGEWNLLGGYGEEAGIPAKRIRMVAGGGFEPPTFGL
jgi:hypothetical protein